MKPGDWVMIDLAYTWPAGYQPDAISGQTGIVVEVSGSDAIVDIRGAEYFVHVGRVLTDPAQPRRQIGDR